MKDYTIEQVDGCLPPVYRLLNPSGVPIATGMSWRTARKIADALNAERWRA